MADAYANSIMVDALILGREGTIVPEHHCYAPPLPGIDDRLQLERWEPWVRAYIAIGEMMQGITLRKAPAGHAFQVLSSASLIAEVGRPKRTTFEKQIPLVLSWAELRSERATEIMAQIDPQYAFWSSIVYLHPDRTRRTFELINLVLQFCVYVEMRFKHAMGCYRPVEYNAEVQPMITTPGHGSFPMGHATQAYAVVQVLKALLELNPAKHKMVIDQLERQAARITTNRVIAGVHFPVDSMAGRMLGIALGEYFVGRCKSGHKFRRRKFLAAGIDNAPHTDFNPFSGSQNIHGSAFYSEAAGANIMKSNLMEHLWDAAQYEWMGRFP
ncbi:phosphatase PAP2 family protein [Bradyrhizobium sp. ISRA464]|uniref:phosphatase PAP2 family protein n=1 Tax=Bradyrhizobium sp. ISRA464 TaxID=2866200 RepID=UPI00247A2F19|nr:phosphatase PAP2 family protein [Bradyrhizobium sp. ISRA464]WGS29372.1 phosphatase PAP2 family protein [Bradyrhizobium sp. ISRA464]